MSLKRSVKRHWFSVMLYCLFAVFFIVASLISAATYVSVVDAQESIELVRPSHSASPLSNGTLLVSFSIDLVNPTRYDLSLYTVNWEVVVFNGTSGPGWIIPVTGDYRGAGTSPMVPARSEITISYDSYVSDPATLSKLNGYVNYTNSLGGSMDIETLPYIYKLTCLGWLDDFEHEYLREFYLNDLVKISLMYNSGWES